MVAITLDPAAFLSQLSNIERHQLPYAGAQALNATAADALKDLQDRMDVVFDRPTRFAKNAFMVWRATKATMEAQVKERPSVGKRHFLKVQETGGVRPNTGLEGLLQSRLAWSGVLSAVTPASGARLDAAGNWSSGERNQALSALGAQRDASSNSTDASRKRAKSRANYFVPKAGRLSPGIWKRVDKDNMVKIAHFTDAAPSYTPRLQFYDGIAEVWNDRLPVHLRTWLDRAIETAR